MPKYKQDFSGGQNIEENFADTYQAFSNLGWELKYAGPDSIVGFTPGKWKVKGQQISVVFDGAVYTVESVMMNNESFDITSKNKKNTAAFINAFQAVQASTTSEQKELNLAKVEQLKEATKIAAVQEEEEARQVNEVMHLEGSNLYLTYALIAINVIVFILMAFDGAGIMEANPMVHIKWGSNVSPLTLSGDYWRLLTNIFIHFGIIHLAVNMYCLYIIGSYLEPMLGKKKYILAYFATGVLASITSLWWHDGLVNSAGASGAIFGLYGLFLALLTTKLIPASVRKSLLQSIAIFVVFNLVYGMKAGVDNSAHVGGLVSGFIFGYLYLIGIQKERKQEQSSWIIPAVLILTLGIASCFLYTHKAPLEDRKNLLSYMGEKQYKDDEKFTNLYDEFVNMQQEAISPFSDSTLSKENKISKLLSMSIPSWEKAKQIVTKAQNLDVSQNKKDLAASALVYIGLRKQEAQIFVELLDGKSDVTSRFDSIENGINAAVELMNAKNH